MTWVKSTSRHYRIFAIYIVDALDRRNTRRNRDEIAVLPDDMRARLVRYSELIEEIGFDALPRNTVKHLQDKLWELRISGRDGISRAIYLIARQRRVVIVRVFVKKTQKTPAREMKLAQERAKLVE